MVQAMGTPINNHREIQVIHDQSSRVQQGGGGEPY